MIPIATGLIGFGMAGASFHAPLIAAEPRLALAAIASTRPYVVSERWPQVAVPADAAALIADPAIELVVIAAPNALHAPLARAALVAAKHVVIDKPFVADPADGAALIELAGGRQRVLAVFHNRRWDGDFRTVEAVLAGGRLGEVRLAEMHWDRLRPAIKRGWREVPGDGSGLLSDLGPHLVDQALRLFGPPHTVTATLLAQRPEAEVDDYFAVTLGYPSVQVILSASTLVASPRPRFALHGTRGSFVKHGLDSQEAVLRAGGSPGDPGFGEDAPESYGTLTADGANERVPTVRGDWGRFYAGVAEAIATGVPPPVSAGEALAGLKLIALARQSARDGRTLAVPGG